MEGLSSRVAQIRARRVSVGLSIDDLARRIGVESEAVAQIESGLVEPDASLMLAITVELGLDAKRGSDQGAWEMFGRMAEDW